MSPVVDLWAATASERASILETFEGLTDDQWDAPSLCGHWTVRQVLGHLVVAADPPTLRFLREVAKARGSFDVANDRLALAQAERPTAELIDTYRGLLSARNAPPGIGPRGPLSDVLLHSLDVRIPLGLPTERPPEHWGPAVELLFDRLASRVFVPPGRPSVRWVATDLDWSTGTGDEIHGPIADIGMAASGRPPRLDALTGPGVAAVEVWLRT